jgi:DNA-binding LacI/PurR family transcriptional regulator
MKMENGDSNMVRTRLSPSSVCVLADDAGAARLAAGHLVSLQRRHIGHFAGPAS